MATSEQIKALVHSYSEGDDERFQGIALQLAAEAARKGQESFAKDLRTLIERARKQNGSTISEQILQFGRPKGELEGLLLLTHPKMKLPDMILETSIREKIFRILLEQQEQEILYAHGLQPIRKIMLTGPPGTGKTLTAGVIAAELHLPLFTIQLHNLITKYMGETSSKLSQIFDAMSKVRGVYLFDEFDALGGERGNDNDIGEMRRILNSFLLFLEQDQSTSIVIAATNHISLLDQALFRRFDSAIQYTFPKNQEIKNLIESHLSYFKSIKLDWKQIINTGTGLSHGDIIRATEQAAKVSILNKEKTILNQSIIASLNERKQLHPVR